MTLSEKLYDYNTHLTNDDRSEIADHIEALEKTDGKAELFIEVIEFAIKTDYPKEFLTCWLEGDFESIKNEWSEFKGYLGEIKP